MYRCSRKNCSACILYRVNRVNQFIFLKIVDMVRQSNFVLMCQDIYTAKDHFPLKLKLCTFIIFITSQRVGNQRSRLVFDFIFPARTIESFDRHHDKKNLDHTLPVIVDVLWPAQKLMTETDEYVCLLIYASSWIPLTHRQ